MQGNITREKQRINIFENEGQFRYFEKTIRYSINIEPRKSFKQIEFLEYVYLMSLSYLFEDITYSA
jgi:hypothetical protein